MSKEIVPVARIAHRILHFRRQKVMLDFDLAVLYRVSTKALNQAVKRNAARFPKDFMFRLSAEETRSLRSQFVTLNRGEHLKYKPYAFTEQGVAMLSSVLRQRPRRASEHRDHARVREIGFHVRESAPRYGTRKRR